MENDKEMREQFSKVLGSPTDFRNAYNEKQVVWSWEEIFNKIGKLQERASRPPEVVKEYWPSTNPMPLNVPRPTDVHYHNGIPCYQNPCTWC